jgi:AcrR family transcriptional regulator
MGRARGTIDGGRGRVLSHDKALAAAREMLVHEGRLDMQALARNLAVSRATLYRVVSSRDRLLGDVLWSFAEVALQAAYREAEGVRGLDRILRTGSIFRSSVLGFGPLRAFAAGEPVTTAMAMFTPQGGMHDRLVGAWRAILLEVVENEGLDLPVDAADLAEIIVRLGGSMLYADLLADRARETDLAAVVTSALVRQDVPEDALDASGPTARPSG